MCERTGSGTPLGPRRVRLGYDAARRTVGEEDRMEKEVMVGLVATAVGAFSCAGAIGDWDWFMNNYRARPLVRLFGRPRARIFYGILGVGIALLGVVSLLMQR
jgi:hypothetical protein